MNTNVPKFDLTIDDDNLEVSVRRILKVIRPDWGLEDGNPGVGVGDVGESKTPNGPLLKSKVLTGGITNKIINFHLGGHPNDAIIFKIYGSGTDSIIDREKEVHTMRLLNSHQLGARLYALFTNGIAYEYVPGQVLNMKNCSEPNVYRLVAAKMGRLHSIPLKEEGQEVPKAWVWDTIEKFTKLSAEAFQADGKLEEAFRTIGITIEWAKIETEHLRKLCERQNPSMPVVFTHNDLLLGNIIHCTISNDVFFIDFEYSGPNYAPYDVANHFNEFAGVEPDEIDYGNYPNEKVRSDWIRVYLRNLRLPGQDGDGAPDSLPFDQTTFERWVTICSPLSHLLWLLWCVVQAASSKLDFDYIGYARTRFPQYVRDMKTLALLEDQFNKCNDL